jgi:exonuclease SbcD
VVIAGNHDSPSFLSAPKELLKALDVHVVANAATSLDDEVLVLRDGSGDPELIVCAVPYLRDRDIRVAEAGESIEDKGRKLIDGIRSHYEQVAAIAEGKRQQLENDIPIVAMGHLFTAGGRTIDGDGVRELYVGSLAYVTAAVFSDSFDYVALGHLHVPQTVGGSETIRYSGSPVPMGFGESNQRKSVCQVEFRGTVASVQMHDIPVFQHLECIKGNWDSISSRIRELSEMDFKGWVEIIYNGEHIVGNLRERLETAIVDTQIEILRIKNNRIVDSFIGQIREEETLDNLHANDVFERCLNVNEVPVDQRPELLQSYKEIVSFLYEDDVQAE